MASEKSNPIPWWLKSIVIVSITSVFCIKVYQTPVDLTFDFPSFLSLLLALFSVALAALFYFKATETSNAFYDNTYKFSQEIGGVLAKIESGFGEKLTHLDETYKGMRESFDQLPHKINIIEAKEELQKEEETAKNIEEEKNQVINNLFEKLEISEQEKTEFLEALESKEEALSKAKIEIDQLRRRISKEESKDYRFTSETTLRKIADYVTHRVIPKLDSRICELSLEELVSNFEEVKDSFPRGFLKGMTEWQFADFSGSLLPEGAAFIQGIAREQRRE